MARGRQPGSHCRNTGGAAFGNYRKHGLPTSNVEACVPDPPEDLSPEARAIWDYTTQLLEPTGLLTRLDRDLLARYCRDEVEHERLQQMIADETDVDALMKLYRMRSTLDVSLRAGTRALGLSPSSRAELRIGVAQPQPETDDDVEYDFFGRYGNKT